MKAIKILIVDHQPIIREGLATILANQEDILVVGAAKNGQEAIQLVSDCRPDVVLLDMKIPIISMLEVLVAIQNRYPDISVIMLTTFTNHDYRVTALGEEDFCYIFKDIEQLLVSIRQCVKGQMVFPAALQSVFVTESEVAVSIA